MIYQEATQHPEIPTSIFVILLCEGEIAFGTEGLGSQPSEWVWGEGGGVRKRQSDNGGCHNRGRLDNS